MRILANDGLSQEGIDVIKNAGIELDTHHIPQEELFEKLNNYDAIIVRSATTVRKDLIDATKLKVIGRAGVGMDNIDVAYAREKGIAVVNTPGASSISVAELVFAHLFSLCRYTHRSTHAMENGEWPKKDYTGIELTGKTIGLIGYGNIAKEVAKRALGLGMKVCSYSHSEIHPEQKVDVCNDLNELLAKSDFVSLHIPLDKEKGATIGEAEIAKMKDGAILINCARGGTVDEAALLNALKSGKLAGAGIDVWTNEPCTVAQTELINHPNVSATPHIGGSTNEAQDRVGIEIAERVVAELKK
ncbi:MAG: 3-phosphoglycerate dehydrogenase [Ignavibacteriae bacterium HGW-Ignavibacteriae-4]|jgi:D-3-phosphoglycerate dehydrogenase|nr:MAG: 3-phosphoglycerate dehydrogenase [Ignavibacteriae bacterium HGW-Ignavibacteriae-4]